MSIPVSIIPSISDTTPNLRTLKTWAQLNPDDGFSSARGCAPGQTQGQQELYTPYLLNNGVWAGSWGANQNSPTISNADFLRIASLQVADSYSVDDKMIHISAGGDGAWGQAIQATYSPSSNWRSATNIKMNQAVYGGNQVEVLERRIMTVDTFGTVPMVRIKTGWDCIHIYTAVTAANVHYTEVKGKIVLPLLPKTGHEWWLLERWLV
jgi:hypothetical protein